MIFCRKRLARKLGSFSRMHWGVGESQHGGGAHLPARPSTPAQAPGVTDQETLDQLWGLRELVAPGTALPTESLHQHDGGREEARLQGAVLPRQTDQSPRQGPRVSHHSACLARVQAAPPQRTVRTARTQHLYTDPIRRTHPQHTHHTCDVHTAHARSIHNTALSTSTHTIQTHAIHTAYPLPCTSTHIHSTPSCTQNAHVQKLPTCITHTTHATLTAGKTCYTQHALAHLHEDKLCIWHTQHTDHRRTSHTAYTLTRTPPGLKGLEPSVGSLH